MCISPDGSGRLFQHWTLSSIIKLTSLWSLKREGQLPEKINNVHASVNTWPGKYLHFLQRSVIFNFKAYGNIIRLDFSLIIEYLKWEKIRPPSSYYNRAWLIWKLRYFSPQKCSRNLQEERERDPRVR